jgi:hypothetical protein
MIFHSHQGLQARSGAHFHSSAGVDGGCPHVGFTCRGSYLWFYVLRVSCLSFTPLTKKGRAVLPGGPSPIFKLPRNGSALICRKPNRAHLALGGLKVLPSYFFFFFLAAFLVAIVGYLSFHWLPSGPNFNSRLRESNSELPLSLLPSWQLSSGRSLPLCSPITAPSPRRKQDHRRRCGISTSGSFTCRALRPLREMTGCSFALLVHSSSEFLRGFRAFRSRPVPASTALRV